MKRRKQKHLTRKDLILHTGATVNQIQYLREMRRLPIARSSKGAGFPVLYKQEAIEVIIDHLSKGNIDE
jgi:hypothetical protein